MITGLQNISNGKLACARAVCRVTPPYTHTRTHTPEKEISINDLIDFLHENCNQEIFLSYQKI